ARGATMPVTVEHDITHHQNGGLVVTGHGQFHEHSGAAKSPRIISRVLTATGPNPTGERPAAFLYCQVILTWIVSGTVPAWRHDRDVLVPTSLIPAILRQPCIATPARKHTA